MVQHRVSFLLALALTFTAFGQKVDYQTQLKNKPKIDLRDYQGDLGKKLEGCMADLPATGGECDSTGFTSSPQTIGTTALTITKPVTIKFGNFDVTQTKEIFITGNNVNIECEKTTFSGLTTGTGTSGVHDVNKVLANMKVTGSNVQLKGCRFSTTAVALSSMQTIAILCAACSQFTIDDMKGHGYYAPIWYGGGALDVTIRNSEPETTSVPTAASQGAILCGYIHNTSAQYNRISRIENNNIHHHYDGIKLTAFCGPGTITGNRFHDTQDGGLDMFVGGGPGWVISNNTFRDTGGYGIDGKYRNDPAGSDSQTGDSAGQYGFSRRNIITDNSFYNNLYGISWLTGNVSDPTNPSYSQYGLPEDLVITNNYIEYPQGFGMLLGVTRSIIAHNKIVNSRGKGFQFQYSSYNLIDGNSVYNAHYGAANPAVAIEFVQAWGPGAVCHDNPAYEPAGRPCEDPNEPKSDNNTIVNNIVVSTNNKNNYCYGLNFTTHTKFYNNYCTGATSLPIDPASGANNSYMNNWWDGDAAVFSDRFSNFYANENKFMFGAPDVYGYRIGSGELGLHGDSYVTIDGQLKLTKSIANSAKFGMVAGSITLPISGKIDVAITWPVKLSSAGYITLCNLVDSATTAGQQYFVKAVSQVATGATVRFKNDDTSTHAVSYFCIALVQ